MASDLEVNMPSLALTRFWGGEDKKSCVQVTQNNSKVETHPLVPRQCVQLTRAEAGKLGEALLKFSKGEETETFDTKVLEDWKWT